MGKKNKDKVFVKPEARSKEFAEFVKTYAPEGMEDEEGFQGYEASWPLSVREALGQKLGVITRDYNAKVIDLNAERRFPTTSGKDKALGAEVVKANDSLQYHKKMLKQSFLFLKAQEEKIVEEAKKKMAEKSQEAKVETPAT